MTLYYKHLLLDNNDFMTVCNFGAGPGVTTRTKSEVTCPECVKVMKMCLYCANQRISDQVLVCSNCASTHGDPPHEV